jgi:hypothetical protein
MPKFCLTLVGLLAVLTAAMALAQTVEEFGIQRLPSVNLMPSVSPSQDIPQIAGEKPITDAPPENLPDNASTSPEPVANEKLGTGEPIKLDGLSEVPPVASLDSFLGYRYMTSSLDWIPGNGDQFGILSLEWDRYVKSGVNNGLGIGLGFHWFSGPVQTDMPPRVYDFSIGYQLRKQLGPVAFDVATSVLAASDFNGNAHKGILFPSHGVVFLSFRPEFDLVFGVDYLDRGDVKLLPVAGLIWKPNPGMRIELVFPLPRAVYQLTERYRIYLEGDLGGGTWAIQRATLLDDLATYRDIRICLGVEHVENDGERTAFEVGYLFDRRLEYTSGIGNMNLNDSFILRLVTRF